jgi:hypothetical protein
MSRHQTTGQNRYIEVADKSFENVAKLECLGTLTHQNAPAKDLGADYIRGMLATMQFGIFCLPLCYLET